MKANKRIILTAVLLVLVLGLGVAGGIALDRQVLNVSAAVADIVPATSPDLKADTASTAGPDLKLIQDAWQTIQQHYVDRSALQSQSLTYGAISGMVDALGDNGHSRFLSPDMLKAEHNSLNGQFEGIGAELQEIDGHAVIVAPFDDSPAQQASLLPDDVILKVNGEDVTQLPLNQVVQRILGPAGTNVTLTVLTPATGKMRDVTITRAKITLHNLTWQQIPGTTIADVRLAEFSKGVSQDLQQALTEIKDQKLTGIILDLRNNPGGLLDEAIGVSSEFLAYGNVLEEQDATGKITPIPISHDYLTTTLPMVVLINQGSASASEITAGALQDAGRATIVGETT